jgi:dTDP-4-dehydrorhamnose reductase
MYGINDHWASIVQRQSVFFFHKFVFVYDDCTALKQPIREWDVAQCVINALKLTESQGKTYELGGPHVLSTLEMHEIIFNTLKVQPKLVHVNPDIAMKVAKYLYNW